MGFAILAPMLWPQVLPRNTLITSLLPPVPQGPPKTPVVRTRPTQATVRSTLPFRSAALVEPTSYLAKAQIIVDPEPEVAPGPGVIGGLGGGLPGGGAGGILDRVLEAGAAPAPRARVEPQYGAVAATPSPQPKRIKLGGVVKFAALVHRVEPVYPQIAKNMRVSGTVELMGVIGTDGRMRELRVQSGHPLLARAALDAVSQWLYQPTLLNGEPVEVIAPITVTFHLN